MVHRRRFLKICSLKVCDIWQNFYFYLILNNENFKMEVEQTNFVTYLIITVQLYYWLCKNPSVKIWSNKFQMVMTNYSKFIGISNERVYVNLAKRNFQVVFNSLCCHGFISYFSLAKFQLVSCNLSLGMIWQMTFTHKLRKLCSATLM